MIIQGLSTRTNIGVVSCSTTAMHITTQPKPGAKVNRESVWTKSARPPYAINLEGCKSMLETQPRRITTMLILQYLSPATSLTCYEYEQEGAAAVRSAQIMSGQRQCNANHGGASNPGTQDGGGLWLSLRWMSTRTIADLCGNSLRVSRAAPNVARCVKNLPSPS